MATLEAWYADPHNQFLLGVALGLGIYGSLVGLVYSVMGLFRRRTI